MKMNRTTALSALAAAIVTCLPMDRPAAQAPATPDQAVAALKQNLAESQKRLRQYEWIETTVISLKGEEKSRKQQRVYYGADGKLTKLPLGEPQPQAASGGGGRRGGRVKEHVVENKKNEMQEYMEKAASLIHQYVPPSPERIQKAKDAGNVQLKPQPDGKARIELRNFVQPADLLAINVDAKASTLTALSVETYLEKQQDVVVLAVGFNTLPDGTNYVARTTLEATAKNISVVVENSGHRPLAK
jgi:hypothetical protein